MEDRENTSIAGMIVIMVIGAHAWLLSKGTSLPGVLLAIGRFLLSLILKLMMVAAALLVAFGLFKFAMFIVERCEKIKEWREKVDERLEKLGNRNSTLSSRICSLEHERENRTEEVNALLKEFEEIKAFTGFHRREKITNAAKNLVAGGTD